ncbi:BRCT domain-containing protein [Rhodococcus sp. 66b]|uniref:BRCT domain-containing protein n=1 Tax=Rhodococcus sp. 66b TaxID=1945511 RepID=UPI0009C63940|nr:BRCT domain-containing protein [Rhodococcus sp. 66b]OQM78047.1 hypothetical protein B0E55_06092 [Rhodococcus sp. 66b]
MSMTRQIAWEECARVGAAANESTTKRTNVLVVGDINPAVLQPGSKVTGKARRAFELQEKGQDIEVMTEDDFLRCLGGKPLDEPEVLLSAEGVGGSVAAVPVPSRVQTVSIALRPEPQPPQQPKPPRALRRTPVPTTQACSVDNCANTAASKHARNRHGTSSTSSSNNAAADFRRWNRSLTPTTRN